MSEWTTTAAEGGEGQMYEMEKLQRAIRTARTARGMSLATLLDRAGMKKAMLYQLCHKSRLYTVERIAKALGMRTSELVQLAEELPDRCAE